MSGWHECLVEDIARPGKNSLATGPFGSAISSKYFVENGIPVIRGGNLSAEIGVRIIDNNFVFVTNEKATEFSRSTVRSGDIIFTCWGTINQIGLIDKKSKYPEYVVSNKQMKLTPDPEKADSLFIYYLFSGPEKQQEIISNGIGAAVPGFNLGQLRKMVLSLPPLPEQKAIASVLSSLDDKIDLLHRQNKTLEAMAETLFRQWFVEEAGEDWVEGCLGDVATFHNGKKRPDGNDVACHPIYGGNGILGYSNESNYEGTTIIVGRVGAYCGSLYIEHKPIWVSDNALVAKPIAKEYSSFLFFLLKYQNLNVMAEGSSHPLLTQTLLKSIPMVCPPIDLIDSYVSQVDRWLEKIDVNNEQICTLEKLRDTLLPKLMSGEVRVDYDH